MSAVNMDVDQSSSVVPQEAPSVVEGGEAPTAMETENTPTADATTDSTAEPSTIPRFGGGRESKHGVFDVHSCTKDGEEV